MEGRASRLKIAVVGSGISGISAAYLLSRAHEVTLFEKAEVLGGHTNTRIIKDSSGSELAIDTGFIVCNPSTYPYFYRFIEQLGVSLRNSDMSFGYFCEDSDLGYTGPAIREFLRQPYNLLDGQFLRMLWEQRRFNQRLLRDLHAGSLAEVPLGSYLKQLGVSDFFINNYLLPLSAAIWSSPDKNMLDFPALTFATFFKNHGMLELSKRPQWQTVVGGSHAYIKAFESSFAGSVRRGCAVTSVDRSNEAVTLQWSGGGGEKFDHVVLAAHADQALAMLKQPSPGELKALSAWRYHPNRATLHTDSTLLPANRNLWASWNYFRSTDASDDQPVAITYYMNRLQGLVSDTDYFVTLNRQDQIDPEKILYSVDYTHPAYTSETPQAQSALREINGLNRTHYCGAYMGYGFHEDGILSAVRVAEYFGVSL